MIFISQCRISRSRKMSDPRFNNRDMITAFIEMAAVLPPLWLKEHKQYHDRSVKRYCFGKLSDVMKTWIPESTPELARTKWNNLKTSYTRQRKEIEDGRKNGAGLDDYKLKLPTLWYYHLMQFLEESADFQRATMTFETESVSSGSDWGSDQCGAIDEGTILDIGNVTSLQPTSLQQNSFQQTSQATPQAPPPAKRRKNETSKSRQQKEEIQVSDFDSKQRTVNECFSEFISKELDDLEKAQAIYARKLIHDVVFYGRQNLLSANTKMIFPTAPLLLQSSNTSATSAVSNPQMSAHTLVVPCDHQGQQRLLNGIQNASQNCQV